MRAIFTGSKSARTTPLLGLAFLISAMSLIGPPAASGAKKSRTGGAPVTLALSSRSGIVALARSISWRFVATIWSRIMGTLDVIHPLGRALESLDKVGERHAVEQLSLFRGDFFPRAMQDAGRRRV